MITAFSCVAIALYRDIGYDDQHQTSAPMNEGAPQRRKPFTGFKGAIQNGTENGTERIPEAAIAFLQNYKNKKRATAERIMRATAERIMRLIVSNSHITILEITKLSGSSERTVKRYLKEFQEADVLRRAGSDTSGEWILS